MFDYELNEYNHIDDIYNNLMRKKTNKPPRDSYPFKREDLITQMLMDKLQLQLNKDPKFEFGRKIYYYEISFFGPDDSDENKMQLIKEKKILKKGSSQEEIFIVNGINYTIYLEMHNTHVKRKKTLEEMKKLTNNKNEDTNTITLATEKSTQKSKSGDRFSTSDTQTENIDIFYRRVVDDYEGKHYIMTITYTNHEVDGNLIALEDFDIKNKLGEILYYPKGDTTKIKKDSKILIEVKQNATLEIIFSQMSKLMKNFMILLPDEKFYYFGFVNENNAKNNLNENEFLAKIQKTENQNPNFKVFLFTIKNNKIFDFDLKDRADYSVHFRNEIKSQIEIMKNDMNDKISGLKDDVNNKISGLKDDVNNKISGLKDAMDAKIIRLKDEIDAKIIGLNEDMNKKIDNLKGEMNGLKVDLNAKINGLKTDINDLKNDMTNQFKALFDMISGLKDNDKNKKNQDQNKK